MGGQGGAGKQRNVPDASSKSHMCYHELYIYISKQTVIHVLEKETNVERLFGWEGVTLCL